VHVERPGPGPLTAPGRFPAPGRPTRRAGRKWEAAGPFPQTVATSRRAKKRPTTVTGGQPGTGARRGAGGQEPRRWIAPGQPIISVCSLTKRFGPHTVLEDVTFDVPKGRTTAILGPSGTGKSVLLKNILGLLTPDRGEIWVDGDQIVGLRERRLFEVRKKFGVLFQDGALFGSMTLYDNIAFPLREHTRKSEREIREVVLRNAELVGLLDHLKKLPGEVSGGMKKRAGLARALVTDPEIVLFDEPDSGLDPVRVAYLDELVNTVQRETGATFFVITHNIASVRRIADFMGILYRSRLVKFASKKEMLASEDPVIRQFLEGRPDGPIGMDEMADESGARASTAVAPAPRARADHPRAESAGEDRPDPRPSPGASGWPVPCDDNGAGRGPDLGGATERGHAGRPRDEAGPCAPGPAPRAGRPLTVVAAATGEPGRTVPVIIPVPAPPRDCARDDGDDAGGAPRLRFVAGRRGAPGRREGRANRRPT
jgi:phospholipid/cholesterol/gamma-HCH transport system ATP-binding protein